MVTAVRRLPSFFGTSFGVAVAVGSMIGAGILRAPRDVAVLLPTPALFLGVWVLGGIYALLGANALAEPGTMRPRSGGQYVIAREAFGPFAGFVVGWSDWLSCCGSVAAIAIVLAETITTFTGRSALIVPLAIGAALAAFLVLSAGSRATDRVQRWTSVLKGLAFLALIGACFAWAATHERAPSTVPFTQLASAPAGLALASALVVAMQGVIFAYDGWVGVLYFAEETRDPGRDIPRALFGGVLAAMGVYVLLNAALLAVLPIATIAADPLPTAAAATAVFGGAGGSVVRALVILALPSAVVANLAMGSRVAFGLGRDTRLLAALGGASENGAPRSALVLSTAVTIGFLFTGTFARVIALCSFLFIASYLMSFAATFRLRATQPDAPRPWRARGHPVTTGIVLLGSAAFLVGTAFAAPVDAGIATGLVLLSYPVYRLLR